MKFEIREARQPTYEFECTIEIPDPEFFNSLFTVNAYRQIRYNILKKLYEFRYKIIKRLCRNKEWPTYEEYAKEVFMS